MSTLRYVRPRITTVVLWKAARSIKLVADISNDECFKVKFDGLCNTNVNTDYRNRVAEPCCSLQSVLHSAGSLVVWP